jgi:glutathione S-transferase
VQKSSSEADQSQSGAIIQYLVDQYDKSNEISYDSIVEQYQTQQWLAFQISGKNLGALHWFKAHKK